MLQCSIELRLIYIQDETESGTERKGTITNLCAQHHGLINTQHSYATDIPEPWIKDQSGSRERHIQ